MVWIRIFLLIILGSTVEHALNAKNIGEQSNLIEFTFNQKNLQDIINEFAQMRDMNIIYPETETISAKVTFDAGRKITMAEAWEFLSMILEQAGYALIPQGGNMYRLVSNKKFYTESVPLYINVNYQSLPDSAEKIRYVYFFNNIQLSSKQGGEVNTILKGILPEQDFAQQYHPDISSNSMILTTRADLIKSVMELITVLDESGFKEAVEIVKLEYAQASEVAQILTNMISGSTDQAKSTGGGYVSLVGNGGQRSKYFSEHAKIIKLDSVGTKNFNSIIIMGKTEDINSIKEFIKKYLDVVQQRGKSFYHVIELQWLQASNFITVLQSLIQGQGAAGGTGQSTSTTSSKLAFDPQIRIVAEQSSSGGSQGSSFNQGGTSSGTGGSGGNRLVIAAPEKDWKRIEALISEVDVPQKQVIIEALVMDLDLSFSRSLGSQLRTRGICPSIFPKDMQAQAALFQEHIINSESNINSLTGDLSQILNPEDGVSENPFCSATESGATTFMIGQGKNQTNGVWGFFQLLSKHTSAKILTRPLILAANNKPARLSSAISKQLAGGTSSGSVPTVNYSTEDAPIQIKFLPIISENDTISLQIDISLNLWQNESAEFSGTKISRELTSKLAMKSGDVVVLGGLTRERVQKTKTSMPFFEKIPVFGNLVSSRGKVTAKDQLFILIRPTVVTPEKDGGMNTITKHAVNYIRGELQDYEDVFSGLKDPITRWFFNEGQQLQSDYVQDKTESLVEKNSINNIVVDDLVIGDDHLVSKDEKPLSVSWLTEEQHAPKEQEKNKKINNLSMQLKEAVNPFQRLSL